MFGRNMFSDALPAGKVTVAGALIASIVFGSALFSYFKVDVQSVHADDVTTSITVLNTPPTWVVDAEESIESSTSTPTNAGTAITWVGTGTDSSNDNYFLLICKTNGAPTAVANGPPTCNGGISNMWARSATTTSGNQASAATTTREYFPFDDESYEWTAWICDANISLPRCNLTYTRGSGSTISPFVVNHPPYFNAITNNSGLVVPLSNVTWTSTSFDNDDLGGSNDTVTLYVCRSNDFTGTYCGAGGSWATSSAATSNAATSTWITSPRQDASYNAYVYLVDQHGLVATSSRHGFNSSFLVNNVAPQVTTTTIALIDTDDAGSLELGTSGGRTNNFKVRFTVTDANSCLNSSAAAEIVSATTSVYRSGIASTSCNVSGHFNSNNCYPSVSAFTNFSCSQDGGSCSGSSDDSVDWTCTFGLWFNADPTDAATPYTSQNWLATVSVTDDDGGVVPQAVEASTGNELLSFLSFGVSSTSIPYGSLEPGATSTISTSTDLYADGNVGLDQDLYGDTMCTTWTTADSCDSNGINPANDIIASNQHFATSTMAWDGTYAFALTGSTTPTELEVRVPKTIATTSLSTRYTYWGIRVPNTITTAGTYSGQNTLTGKKSPAAFW